MLSVNWGQKMSNRNRERALAIGALIGIIVGIFAYGATVRDSYIPSPAILYFMLCLYPAIGAVIGAISAVLIVMIFDKLLQ